MAALLRLLFAALLLGLFISGVFYFVANVLSGIVFNPESKAWKALLTKLRARFGKQQDPRRKPLPEIFLPSDGDTLANLSLKPKMLKKAGWLDNSFEGVFSTIYQEPVLVFAGQKGGKAAVILAKTRDKEYVFRHKGKETEIWQDNQPFAVLVNGTLLSSGKQSRMLAKLEQDPALRQWPVLIGNSEAATMTNAERAVSPIPRAVTMLRDLNAEEEQTLLILAVIQGLLR